MILTYAWCVELNVPVNSSNRNNWTHVAISKFWLIFRPVANFFTLWVNCKIFRSAHPNNQRPMEHVQPWQVLRVIAVIDSPGTEYSISLAPSSLWRYKAIKTWYQMLRTFDGALQGFVLVSSGFHLNVENSSHLLWFYIVTLPLAEKPRATFSSYQKWNQNQSWLARARFPALCISVVYRVRALIGSLYCLCLLWLARVISLTLVLRHSNENLCIVSDWVLNCLKSC